MSIKVKENNVIKAVSGVDNLEHSGTTDNALNILSPNPVNGNIIKSRLESVSDITATPYPPSEYGVPYDTQTYITEKEWAATAQGLTAKRNAIANEITAHNTAVDAIQKSTVLDSNYLKATQTPTNTVVTGNTQIWTQNWRNANDHSVMSLEMPRVYFLSTKDFIDDPTSASTWIDMSHFVNIDPNNLIPGDRFDFFVTGDIVLPTNNPRNPSNVTLAFGEIPIDTDWRFFTSGLTETQLTSVAGPFNSNNAAMSGSFIDYFNTSYRSSYTSSTDANVRWRMQNGVTLCLWNSPTSYRLTHLRSVLDNYFKGTNIYYKVVATSGAGITLVYDGSMFRVLGCPQTISIGYYRPFISGDSITGRAWEDWRTMAWLKWRADGSWSFDGDFITTSPTAARSSAASTNTWRLYIPICNLTYTGNLNRIVQANGYAGINASANGAYPHNNKQARAQNNTTATRDGCMNMNTLGNNISYIPTRVEQYSNMKFISLRGTL